MMKGGQIRCSVSKLDEAAKGDRWEEAMVVIRDATIEVRRGLRLLGVSM